ncbi:MAG: NAD(P)H-hydrate dehydratase, partial [Calditrichia bacterium]|nr:NAD(P)H-hydrate dehydratase [Calditrichia bacterium]
ILIDGGPNNKVLEKLGQEMDFFDRDIDMVILTHPDADHLTGLIEVLKYFDVGLVLTSGFKKDTAGYQRWINLIEEKDIIFPLRYENAHKYKFGRILIIAGSYGMVGAAVMAAKAASLIGGGMIHLAVPASVYEVAASLLMGEIVVPLEDHESGIISYPAKEQLLKEIEWADCILMGPGIGIEDETIEFIQEILSDIEKPVIIDADAIRAVNLEENSSSLEKNWIITPHYGEFSRLTSLDSIEIRNNPLEKAIEFAAKNKIILNLKNAPSIVTTPLGEAYINSTGNAALAKAGSGDVLAGIMVGLIGQGVELYKAAYYSNYIHGYIADLYLINNDEYSLTPEKILDLIPEAIKKINAFE